MQGRNIKVADIRLGQEVLHQRRNAAKERDTLCLYESQGFLRIPFGNHDNPLGGDERQDKRT